MKNQKGITLITLAITIIVMSIIAGVVTYSGIESVNNAKKTAFISELEMIQAKVNTIYEKRKSSEEEANYYNQLGTDASMIEDSKVTTALGETSKEGFRYFSTSDLRTIGLDNINQEVLINYDTREVISITGIKIDGVMYYKLRDIPNYSGYNVEYTNTNTKGPTFTVDTTKLSNNSYRLTIKDIVYNSNVEGGTVSYKLHNDANWILNGTNTSFEVTEPGLYDIRFKDVAGNETIQKKQIGIEAYREDFDKFNYKVNGANVNSCANGILNITSTNNDPMIFMNNVTMFNPREYRYIEIKYKTLSSAKIEMFMIENPKDGTYRIATGNLSADGQWNTVVIDLWSNENVKNRDEITGWRFDWFGTNESGINIEIDYIRVIKEEIYIEDFDKFNYRVKGAEVNSCANSTLNITSTNNDPMIFMNDVTMFDPKEYRYIEIKYKTLSNAKIEMFMIENPKDQTYSIVTDNLSADGQWNTVVIDLWSNENVKNRDEITGWRFDWFGGNESGVSIEIDYIRVIFNKS